MEDNFEIDFKKRKRIFKAIKKLEETNLSTKEFSDREMKDKIKKIIKDGVNECY